MVKMLISEFNSDMSIQTVKGATALMLAALGGHYNVVQALICEHQCPLGIGGRDKDGYTLLHYACNGGNVSLVQTLIQEHKADVNERDDENDTPLHVAALAGKADVALLLISEYGCDPNVRGQLGRTVLHHACDGGNVGLVQTLIQEHKADVNERDNENDTPLHVAAVAGKADVALLLISEYGCDHNVRGQFGRTVLHHACEGGNVNLVQTLIQEHKADVNERDNENDTPLHVAAVAGKADVALLLISEYGCDPNPNVRGHFGRTVLHHACSGGNVNLVQTLIQEHKADVNERDNENDTPLHVAALAGKADVALLLISEYGCDPNPNVRGQFGRTVLHDACSGGNVSLIQTLIREHKADINERDIENDTPLHVAAFAGKADVAMLLISEHGCDPNVRGKFGRTVLHNACEGGNVSLVQILIQEHKADVNARDDKNNTPLHVAALAGKADVALLLISEYSCKTNVRGQLGRTVLHHACDGGNVSLVQTLIREHKADVNERDNENDTPFHVAAFAGKADVALLLISEYGCDPNVRGQLGRTVLHHACDGGNVSLVQTLIQEHKADVNERDNENDTPLHVAALARKADVALLLISEYGCDPNVRGQFGRTVLHHACEGGNVSLVQILIQEYKADVNERDKENDTPLHVAALAGKADVALLLISEYYCDSNVRGDFGRTVLHDACYGGSIDLVRYLLPIMSLLDTDYNGETPLHWCSFKGHVECVEALLHSNAPVLVRNNNSETPLEVATGRAKVILGQYMKENKNKIMIDYNSLLLLAKKKYSATNRLLILGNPGAGKSSLVEALKREGFFESLWRISESSVAPHTAGIVPSSHTSKYYGRVWFYDFAGDPEYYSSHAAILENLASSTIGENLIMIVVNMTDDDVKSTLHYWFSFIQCQRFLENFSLFIVGSHSDLLTKDCISEQVNLLHHFCTSIQSNSAVKDVKSMTLDCCKPRSKEMAEIQKEISTWASDSTQHTLSDNSSLLLGLLEKDFSNVTACSIQTVLSHIEDSGVCLPREAKHIYSSLSELHDVGALLLLGDHNNDDCQVVLKCSELTNEVHQKLFSEAAIDSIKEKCGSSNIGILPDDLLLEILPPYITKQCLIYLQYCHEIKCEDIDAFPALSQQNAPGESFVFFPAFCKLDKCVSVNILCGLTYSIGWLARCTHLFDHFPPRFLHVLLLRLVFRFTLSAPTQSISSITSSSPEHSYFKRCCTMWKTGVHWLMTEGVECMVELVDGSKGVVIITKSKEDLAENCVNVFNRIFSCVMEAKEEFCHAIRPDFFLLDSTKESDYLNEDHLFAMSDVETALAHPERSNWILSVSRKRPMESSKLFFANKLNFWLVMFPIDMESVLHHLMNIVDEVFDLGLHLKVPYHILEANEKDFPTDANRRKREMVNWWVNSSLDPPCWWHLVQALNSKGRKAIAKDIEDSYSK